MQRTIALKLVDKGLSDIEPSAGFMVVYAAKHGETALDGEGTDSPFAVAVARDVKEPHVEVRKLFDIVRDDVWNSTKHEQQPFTYGSPPGREIFISRGSDAAIESAAKHVPGCSSFGWPLQDDECTYTTTLSRFAARVMPV